jgi:DNA polymerase III subunit delta
MQSTAQQTFKELEQGIWKPFYVIAGEEPFQSGEIVTRLKNFFIKDEVSGSFNFESFDGEHLDVGNLVASLETLPGLFDGPNSKKLVLCSHFEKIQTHALEALDHYLTNPAETTCLIILISKVDKRKNWYKFIDQKGAIIEVTEPYDREWPKWQGYFEKKIQKKISMDAWQMLLENSNRSLSMLWSDLQKMAVFVGNHQTINRNHVLEMGAAFGDVDIFSLAEDVLARKKFSSVRKYHQLIRQGESEVKILSILVRQFRLVEHTMRLHSKGVLDSKVVAQKVGVHPFFVSKIIQQAKFHTVNELGWVFEQLTTCDYLLKTGQGSVFENFLMPYLEPPKLIAN